jgi:hypothetical protein
MSETRLLMLVLKFPHPTALARHLRDGAVFAALRRLEAYGFVRRREGLYCLTAFGRAELEMTVALQQLMARPGHASGS